MKATTSTIAFLVSAFLTVSAAPIVKNIPAVEIASPEGYLSVVRDDDVTIRADTDVNETAEYGVETGETPEDLEGAGEASQFDERNVLPHACECVRSVPHEARSPRHRIRPCAPLPAAPIPTTTVVFTTPAPTPAPKPVPVPVPAPAPKPLTTTVWVTTPAPTPAPKPVPVPVPVPAPQPAPVPVPVPVPAPAPEPVPVPVPVPVAVCKEGHCEREGDDDATKTVPKVNN